MNLFFALALLLQNPITAIDRTSCSFVSGLGVPADS